MSRAAATTFAATRDQVSLHDHHDQAHGHSHGLIDPGIGRSRASIRVVLVSLAVFGVTSVIQGAIYIATGATALLADLIHNFGDALTAIPLGVASYCVQIAPSAAPAWPSY